MKPTPELDDSNGSIKTFELKLGDKSRITDELYCMSVTALVGIMERVGSKALSM